MPGKFDSLKDELLYELWNGQWANNSFTSECCSFATLIITREDLEDLEETFPKIDPQTLLGHWFIREDDFGFVFVEQFNSKPELYERYREWVAAHD